MTTAITTLVASLINAEVVRTLRDGTTADYVIKGISEKTGVMKNGTHDHYIILADAADDSKMINVHPQSALKLLKNGQSDNLEIVDFALRAITTEQPAEGQQQADTQEAPVDQPADLVVATTTTEVAATNVEAGTEQQAEDQQQADTLEAPVDQPQVQRGAFSMMASALALTPKDEQKEAAAAGEAKISKKALALPIVQAGLKAGDKRKDIINKLIAEVDLSKHGAATYYQNIASGQWA